MTALSFASRLLVAATTGLGLLAATASPALPCSAPAGWATAVPFPADGATEVPTNARLAAIYVWSVFYSVESEPGFAEHLALRDASGAEVAVERKRSSRGEDTIETLVPVAPLAPDATYQLVDHLGEASTCMGSEAGCLDDEPTVIATFTTGSGPDVTAPTFAGLATLSSRFAPASVDDPCGAHSYVDHALHWNAATDDGPAEWIRYNVYNADGAALATSVELNDAGSFQACTGIIPTVLIHLYATLTGGPRFQVRAVDLAGNEDPNAIVLDGLGCAHFDSDADGQLDPGVSLDGEVDTGGEVDQGGCSAGGSVGAPGLAIVALLTFGGLAIRRRRGATRA
jgi:uncharacterized protein (TIGR03382 family)